jgi:chromate transporter
LPQATFLLYGIKPVIIAIVIQALWGLGKSAVKGLLTAIIGAAVLVLFFLGFDEILLLFAAGVIAMAAKNLSHSWKQGTLKTLGVLPIWLFSASEVASATMVVTPVIPVSLIKLTLFF